MTAIYTPFKSISEIKERGEHLKPGQIYPRRILAAEKRKDQCRLVAGANCYAIPTPNGYIVLVENNDGYFKCVVMFKSTKISVAKGSKYIGGSTHFCGNSGLSHGDWLIDFNRRFLAKSLISDGTKDNTEQLQINLNYRNKHKGK